MRKPISIDWMPRRAGRPAFSSAPAKNCSAAGLGRSACEDEADRDRARRAAESESPGKFPFFVN
ncbi:MULTISPECIES: hypothetical protein [unclassified Bosea (in: a-proteobacteria)]|uniref:hypothetical protein n=1 Tax=unclassified Bosea (in: a-proteobacteria) TaxID=2653178 RepID=UPI00125F3525|nr:MULTISPECIES: hypothetical protein [unclassified Bosea (in: a-proteobacteria)]